MKTSLLVLATLLASCNNEVFAMRLSSNTNTNTDTESYTLNLSKDKDMFAQIEEELAQGEKNTD